MIKLFVGLGNPGPEYEATRHNAGFWWIDALARDLKVNLVPEKSYYGLVARTVVDGHTICVGSKRFMDLEGVEITPEVATALELLCRVIVTEGAFGEPGMGGMI